MPEFLWEEQSEDDIFSEFRIFKAESDRHPA